MKRFLSIILALAMIVGMIPAVFAETTEGESTEPVSVTYKFQNGGRSDVSGDWLERVYCTPASALGAEEGATYYFVKNSAYMELPTTTPEDPGENWAYIGTNLGRGVGRMTSTDSENDAKYGAHVEITASTAPLPYLSVNKKNNGEWIAFRVKVPQTANYEISKVTAYKYASAASAMEMYLVPASEELEAVFAASEASEKAAAALSGNYYYGDKSGAKAFSDFGDLSGYFMGKANIYASSSAKGMGEGTLSDCEAKILEADKEYYLFLYTGASASGVMSISTLTLEGEEIEPEITTKLSVENLEIDESATLSSVVTDELGEVVEDASVTYTTEDTDIISLSGNTVTALSSGSATVTATATVNGQVVTTTIEINVSVNLTPVYKFTKSAIVDGTTAVSSITDYSMINTEVSTGKWMYYGSPNVNSNMLLNSSGVQFNSYLGNAKAGKGTMVLKIKVDASGLYNPVIDYVKQPYCGRIDMFAIPEAVANENEWDLTQYSGTSAAIAYCTDKDNAGHYMASIDMHTDSAETSPRNGNAVYLSKGDNYLLMRIRQGCGTSTHSSENYYGYVSSISLSPAAAGLMLSLNEYTIRPSEQPQIIASGVDANGNAAEITAITYESLDTSVATVDSATGVITPVGEGIARIAATATIGEAENVAAQIPVTVYKEWNPVFTTNKLAVKEESIQGSTISCTKVIDYNYLDRSVTTGLWKYETRFNFGDPVLYGGDLEFGISKAANLGKGNNALVLNAMVDATGVYDTSIGVTPNANGGIMDVYLVPKSYTAANNFDVSTLENVNAIISDCEENEASEAKYIGSADANANTNPSTTTFDGATVKLTAGEHYIIIVVSASEGATGNEQGRYWGLLKNLTLDNVASVTLIADSAIEKGETTELRSVAYDEYYNAVSADVTYESLTPAVATLSGNTVTALTEGNAVIKATATIDGVTVTDTVTIKVSPKKVSVATQIGDNYSVKQWTMGADVKVTAPEITGKVFRHWVLGTEENGIPVSESASYTFKAVTNTYLTAVYSVDAAEGSKAVEFYAENGAFIGIVAANAEGKVEDLPGAPSITGYDFSAWKTDKETIFDKDTVVTDAITKVVATYNAATISEGVFYGDPVKNEEASEKLWKRDGKVVAWGKSYTYYVWTNSTITSVDGEKPTEPIIVLDEASKGTARMIEYDAAGFDIIEAGILFGNGTEMTVDSCMYKAKSNRNLSHGQFTAKPADNIYTTAIGYIVYVDGNGDYQVVYSK